ncbi:hypothetical protein ACFQO7_21990 [Catellatospora aurea]|uniref:Secreted protein n=1 Tax=Catellatospora aurea TaxID=1337874 RepID=A0ABW2GZT5_9ACTN
MTPEVIVTATLTTATGVYALACWVRPFGRCRACSGTGVRRTVLLRTVTTCRRCKGARLRLRIGRRIYNTFHNANTEAARATRAKDTTR